MACQFSWEASGVVKTFSGFVTRTEFTGSAEAVAADPRFDDQLFIINDFLAIDGHSIDVATCLQVAASRPGSARTNPNFRVAFIASGDVARDLAAAVEPARQSAPFDPQLFVSVQEAREWLDDQPRLSYFRASSD
jgi:hypothetical protein